MTDPAPSKVKVVVRIRPFVEKEVNKRCVTVSSTDEAAIELRRSTHAPVLSYGFDGAYDSDSKQEDLFKNEIEPMLESVFKGIHTTIFAYGITGAGKTFTMQGTDEQPGLIPRVARKVLAMAAERSKGKGTAGPKCSVGVSYLEIYNEKVFDLLRPKNKDLPIREDMDKNILIPNLAQLPVKTYDDFANTYAEGCKNRTVAPTSLNAHSSRSHAVLIITVKHRTDNRKYVGKLHLIDLAGSEDNRRTDNTGIRMTESTNINKSLFVLGKVVNALNEGSTRVPYRDSKLTRMLQDSLGGRSYGVMIANISPSVKHYQDTFNTLNFASKSRQIINKPIVNAIDDEATRKALLEEYLELKKLRMPSQGAKENRNPNSRSDRSGQKMETKDIDAYIQEKTKEAIEERLREMLGGEKALKERVAPEVFQMMQDLKSYFIETNKQLMEQCLNEDEDEIAEKDPDYAINDDDAKVMMLTPFTKVATGVNMARRAKKYAKRGQYDRAIRYYRRLLNIMPEKEAMIQKKISKLEQLKVTNLPAPTADSKPGQGAKKENAEKRAQALQRQTCSTPGMRTPSASSSAGGLSSMMRSLSISDGAPKKLSFDNCAEDEIPKAKAGIKPSALLKQTPKPTATSRFREELKRRQATPAGRSTSAGQVTSGSSSRSQSTKTTVSETAKRREAKPAIEARKDGERRSSKTKETMAVATKSAGEKATTTRPSSVADGRPIAAKKPMRVEVEVEDDDEEEDVKEEKETSEEEETPEEDEEEDEEEEEEEERPQRRKKRVPRYSFSESEEDEEEDDRSDGDYEEASPAEEDVDVDVPSKATKEDDGHEAEREVEVLRVVNEGTMKQLLQLHGIGKKRAEGIIENRPFSKLADLKKIGLGEKLFEAFMKRNVWEPV